MNELTDRPTPIEREGAPDCLVEMAVAWLQRPLAGLTDAARSVAIEEGCLLIAQMRHRDTKAMEYERRRWAERMAVRLCHQCGIPAIHSAAVQGQVERCITAAMLTYHTWREQVAPPFNERRAA